jgi:hypothetical protein
MRLTYLTFSLFSVASLFVSVSGSSLSCCFFFLVFVFILWFDESPLFLFLDGPFEGSVVIASAVVADASVPPELVDCKSAENNVRVVDLVIVADPGADEAPSSFNSWISAKSGNLLGFAT